MMATSEFNELRKLSNFFVKIFMDLVKKIETAVCMIHYTYTCKYVFDQILDVFVFLRNICNEKIAEDVKIIR